MSPREFERWGRTRKKGFVRFASLWGTACGVMVFLATYLLPVLLGGGQLHLGQALDGFVRSVLTGGCIAAGAWFGSEWKYKRIEARGRA